MAEADRAGLEELVTIFFSRFPDEPAPEVKPLPAPEVYSIHPTDTGLLMTVRWTVGPDGWEQHSPIFVEGIALAREMVPPEGIWIPDCPPSFALEAYEVRA